MNKIFHENPQKLFAISNIHKCHCTFSPLEFFIFFLFFFLLESIFMKKLNNFPCHLFFTLSPTTRCFYPQLKLILIIFNSLLQRFCCFSSSWQAHTLLLLLRSSLISSSFLTFFRLSLINLMKHFFLSAKNSVPSMFCVFLTFLYH